MNKILAFYIMLISFFIACTNMQSTSRGLENEAFLEFIGDTKKYSKSVEIHWGEEIKFNASVHSEKDQGRKGKVYSVPTGSHKLEIFYEGELIYSKQIFVSNQETKSIFL